MACPPLFKPVLILAIVCLLAGEAVHGATAPFSENFDSYDNNGTPTIVPTGFSESPGSQWNVRDDAIGNDYEFAVTQVDGSGSITQSLKSSGVALTNVVGNSFTMSAKLTLDAATGSGSSFNDLVVGLQFLGSAGFSPGYTAELDVLGTGLGTMRISENDGALVSGSISGTLATGTAYQFTVTGNYVPGGLNLSFGITGSGVTGNLSFLDPTPQTQTQFGFRNLVTTGPGGTVTLDVDFDNLSVALIPEPNSTALLLAGIVLAAGRRRNSSRTQAV